MRLRVSIRLRPLAPLLCLPFIAFAAPAVRAQAPPDEWHFNLGAAIAGAPEYPGSAAQKTRLAPIPSATLGRFFIGPVPGGGPLGIGGTLYQNDGLRGGDIGGKNLGALATLEAEALFHPAERWSLGAGPCLTWADPRYTQTVFGVDATQSVRSGRTLHEPGAGVSLARLAATLSYRLDAHGSLGARLSLGRLLRNAADSPLTEQRPQNSGALFTSCWF